MDFEQWWKEYLSKRNTTGHSVPFLSLIAADAYAAGRQAQREVISDEKLVISRIKLLIENCVDDSEELPERILNIVNAAIRRGGA